jgi:hypothetical protein
VPQNCVSYFATTRKYQVPAIIFSRDLDERVLTIFLVKPTLNVSLTFVHATLRMKPQIPLAANAEDEITSPACHTCHTCHTCHIGQLFPMCNKDAVSNHTSGQDAIIGRSSDSTSACPHACLRSTKDFISLADSCSQRQNISFCCSSKAGKVFIRSSMCMAASHSSEFNYARG